MSFDFDFDEGNGGNYVLEEFDKETGELIKVGDYNFSKIELGKGAFASVRLAFRPSRIKPPQRMIVKPSPSAASTRKVHNGPRFEAIEEEEIKPVTPIKTKGLKIKNFLSRKNKNKSPNLSNSNLSSTTDDDQNKEMRDDSILVYEKTSKDFWINKLSRSKSDLVDAEKSIREGTTVDADLSSCLDAEFVAVKIFNKSILKAARSMKRDKKTRKMSIETAFDLVNYEVALMKKMYHPNLVKLHEIIDSPQTDTLYCVLEYCPLGQIMEFDEAEQRYKRGEYLQIASFCQTCGVSRGRRRQICVCKNGHFDESHAAGYTIDILCALGYLHRHYIAHRDLKPENILLDAHGHCKIADFGISKLFPEEAEESEGATNEIDSSLDRNPESFRECEKIKARSMSKKISKGLITKTEGTYCFYSPEMCKSERYSAYQADMWAVGICSYIFVTGELPYFSKDPSELFDKILQEEVDYPSALSLDCIDFLKSLLYKDPNERAGVGDCLRHQFIDRMRYSRASMSTIVNAVDPLLEIFDSEMQVAITKISMGTAAFVATAAVKLKKYVSQKRDRMRAMKAANADAEPVDVK